MSSKNYDFIVVGAGPCGSSLATRIAQTSSKPSVLLLEAGGRNNDPEYRVASERHTFWNSPSGLRLDYGYQTVPQLNLDGRQLAYHRGKGMGGSTCTNLGVWDYGSQPEMDEWARIVSDDVWSWKKASEQLRRMENHHDLTPEYGRKYVRSETKTNGTDGHGRGPVDITSPGTWDPQLQLIMKAVEAHGLPFNSDLSSDKCLGFGVPPATILDGSRVTASSAYLEQKTPANLHILTHSQVTKIIFEGKKATGVQVANEAEYYASKETIICAGAIDTPKLLLLSGVGPGDELAKHGISPVLHLPGVGLHLKDHPMIRVAAPIKPGVLNSSAENNPTEVDFAAAGHGYFKIDDTVYPEFKLLDEDAQHLLSNPLTPAYELLTRIVPNPGPAGGHVWIATIVMMNSQSDGRVFLQSDRPMDSPDIDLNFLSHPYDVRSTTEAVRRTSELLLQSSVIPTDGLMIGPKRLDDEEILKYIRGNLSHLWHAAGTVKMGRPRDDGTCVTPDFRVAGLEALRVADLSVLPIMPSNHVQSTAYFVGEVAADKIIAEYDLLQGTRVNYREIM